MKNNLFWKLCIALVILLCVLSFTPLIIPSGSFLPMLFGLPRTLWAGMLVYAVIVFLTFLGTRVYPESEAEEEKV